MTERRILVVDDSPTMRAVILRLLEDSGYELLEAGDGAYALQLAAAEPPDAILLDVEMPGMDGLEVLDALQADDALRDVPVVMVTARASGDDVAEGLRRGAHDYLRKPFAHPELVARVHAVMRTKALQDELRERNEALERLAGTDALTGLANRRQLDRRLREAASRSRRHGVALSAVVLDLDGFKAVNDEHGHAAGDAVLAEVARRIAGRLREEDLAGRWGGEEFLVIAGDTDTAGAQRLAEGLRACVAETPFALRGGPDLQVTTSVGHATWTGPDDDAEALVRRADAALYAAKAAGRDAVRGG